MITKATIYLIPILGTTIILRGHLMNLFLGLFVFLVLLDVADLLTKIRYKRLLNQVESTKWRAGISQKISEYSILSMLALMIYYALGAVMGMTQPCTVFTIAVSAIPNIFLTLYIIGALLSVTENNVEYYKAKGIKPDRATLFMIRFFGLLQGKIENEVIKKISGEKTKETPKK